MQLRNSNIPEDDLILEMILKPATKDAGFRYLMEKYQEDLYWHIRRILHVHEDTDDVLQNTFIKIYRNLGKFAGNSKLYTWMYRIATNEAITYMHDRSRRNSASLETSIHYRLKADEYFSGDDASKMLIAGIESLPEKQKLVFNMRYFQSMSYQDMSEVLDTSVGALKASYHHAVKKLEAFIKEKI